MKSSKKTAQPELTAEQLRNNEVAKAFEKMVASARELLQVFDTQKYRTTVIIEHAKMDKETNLIREFICYFWNLTMTTSKSGAYVIYFAYDSEAIAKFGKKLLNQLLREIFRHTMYESTSINIENCIRINTEATEVHNFFYKRLMDGVQSNICIAVEEQRAA